MITNKKWVATGSTATLIAGGLFFGAPAASAAPGDAACLQASVQFNAALNAAGIDVAFVNQLEVATAAVVAAGETLATVTASLNVEGLAVEAETTASAAAEAQRLVIEAEVAIEAAVQAAILADLDGDGDPENDPAVIAARAALIPLAEQERIAAEAAVAAKAAYAAVQVNAELVSAQAAFDAAVVQADALIAQLSGDEALAAELIALFKAFLAACDAGAIGVTPVVNPTVPVTVIPTPTGTNKGMNVQTAAATEDNSAALALIAGLLAAGVAVPVAMAARMRRLERAQR
ncbi:hypothetical protein [Arthrobacter zhaoguopingii]|uniref:hypothetical protein n=1 Tax=Arthrobacter zhaoguopingii TaxID=2681491 RepID=UPI001358AB62|nr:hypothetical protein [Arthrobacter zhaoguopingii]